MILNKRTALLPATAAFGLLLLGGCGDKSKMDDASSTPAAPAANNTTAPGPMANGTPTTPTAMGGNAPVATKMNGTQTNAQPAGVTPGGPGGTMMNKPSQNPNGAMGDAVITAKVKSAIIADKSVGAGGVNVDTKSGVVVLRGGVSSMGAKMAAEADAKKMQGVTKVINQLTVSGPHM